MFSSSRRSTSTSTSIAALRAGASGFLLKDAPREQLVGAVRTVAAGDALLAPALVRRLVEDFVRRPAPGSRPTALDELTGRELEVLRLIARGLSNAEIARKAGSQRGNRASTHVTHVLAKLDLRDRVQAVVLAYETGLVRPGEDDVER